ncbi:MAG: type VI secretion system tube protein Hcp [Deltaproteobacteria bacterium]|nr:type VI secretion system tube protein Hcp [Deltaproteobacteria bacterium]
MPIPAYLNIPDIPGSVKVEGREDTMQIVGFDHGIHIPMDVKDGTASGTRVHGQFKILKNYDKASPELYKFLCQGKTIPQADLSWYEIDDQGNEKVYFTHTLQNAKVTNIKAWMPNVDDPQTERYKHMEEVSFQYEKITWKFTDGNVEASDSWLEGR